MKRAFLSHTTLLLLWLRTLPQSVKKEDKDLKQLLQYGKAIGPVTTWFEIQLNTQNTVYIKSISPACWGKRLALFCQWISVKVNCWKALPLQILYLFLSIKLCFADSQYRPLSCEASLWQVSRPGVAAQLGRLGEEFPYPPSKSTINYT